MTKFEQRGIDRQYGATSAREAAREFKNSCYCCATKGIHLSCDNCVIAIVHNLVKECFIL